MFWIIEQWEGRTGVTWAAECCRVVTLTNTFKDRWPALWLAVHRTARRVGPRGSRTLRLGTWCHSEAWPSCSPIGLQPAGGITVELASRILLVGGFNPWTITRRGIILPFQRGNFNKKRNPPASLWMTKFSKWNWIGLAAHVTGEHSCKDIPSGMLTMIHCAFRHRPSGFALRV